MHIQWIHVSVYVSNLQVYALMEELVDSLCDTMDELNEGDEQDWTGL